MKVRRISGVNVADMLNHSCFRPPIQLGLLLLLLHCFGIRCTATELKQNTVDAFGHYVHDTESRMDGEVRSGGPFLWVDSLPQQQRKRLYDLLQRGEPQIRQEKTEEEGKTIEVPDGLIHHWTGVAFAPGVSIERVLSLLQDYDNHSRTYKPDVRQSKLLEHTDDSFKIYLQFYKESPRRVSFNTEFEVHYARIDATHLTSRAVSARVAELEHPELPDSPEFPVNQGHGYLWRLNNYWRLEAKDGGVYMQVESIALSRDVPAFFWFVRPVIRRVSRQSLLSLLSATQRGLSGAGAAEKMGPPPRNVDSPLSALSVTLVPRRLRRSPN
jgi:hypothetical protein